MVAIVIASIVIKRLLAKGRNRLARWRGMEWLDKVRGEAARKAKLGLRWSTISAVVITGAAGLVYHIAGRDVRVDLLDWYRKLTWEELLGLGTRFLALGIVVAVTWLSVKLLRRALPISEKKITHLLRRDGNEATLRNWFWLLEIYSITAALLIGALVAVSLTALGDWGAQPILFVLRVVTILALARLATLAWRGLSRTAAEAGSRYFNEGQFSRYWERILQLFPFAERCFEAAVYVAAASMCVEVLSFIESMAEYGPRVVKCIGILFVSRVIIELFQVLLHQAFDLYGDDGPVDQKARTLVPLLYSISQYVLYFGAGVYMLDVLKVNTTPILAGAGIIGLAVGLGAQNLVTDVVSGFFILFENQYLVGDFVQLGDASGIVEAVGIRLTQVRDGQGKLYIIPNGQIKGVINYSKGFVNAVVDVRQPSGSDLETVIRVMAEAGRRLKQSRKEVLADTEILGLVELNNSEMTIRAVTKVRPGTHVSMQNEYRRLLKQIFDQNQAAQRSLAAAA
jgi:small conductance mechanosensitive channel